MSESVKDSGIQTKTGNNGNPERSAASVRHDRHCFVIMPSGREPTEMKWYRGWYEVVIKPSVVEVGYEPILAAAEEQPSAINDEIRTHLAMDPMVVVDLGGTEPEDEPNPNVMYELGIRHALGLPLVMMAWKGQRLPFDVSNQRVIMEDRDLVDLDVNRRKLVSFIRAAEQGRYYRPMDAVSRQATIQAASETLTEDSVLRALAQEVRDLRGTLASAFYYHGKTYRRIPQLNTMKHLIQKRLYRKELYANFVEQGGDPSSWAKLLRTPIEGDTLEAAQGWGVEEWKAYIKGQAIFPPKATHERSQKTEVPSTLEEDLLQQVRTLLPEQPWPTGVHKTIAEKLSITNNQASKYIAELIRRHDFLPQSDGSLIRDDEGS